MDTYNRLLHKFTSFKVSSATKSRVCIDNVFYFRDTVRKYVIIIFKSNMSCNCHIENCAVKNVIFHFKKDKK